MTVDNNITEEEQGAIDELRKRMKGDMNEELYNDIHLFRRFLKARDLNLNNAEAMLRKHLEWRKKLDVDNALKYEKTEVMKKYAANQHLGFDKDGCFIRYCQVGNHDFVGIVSALTFDEITKFLLYEMETETYELKKQSKKLGKNVEQCIYIYDMQNFSFVQASDKRVLHTIIFLLSMWMNNYPERMKASFIFNTSVYFYFAYAAIKPLMPATILKKINIYSDDSYKEDLLKHIDADVLPKFLGGNKTDPDGNPLCSTFVKHELEKVPESCYIRKDKKSLSKLPGTKRVTLSRAAFHEVILEVKEPGSYLEWEFETKCRDIGFGLFYNEEVDGEEKITELVAIQRIDTALYPETGTFRCENAGTYVIVFDNTYSWVRAKEIFFRTKIVTPKEHEAEIKKE